MSTSPADASGIRTDRFESARLIADAVLYEGYVLYPYRASAQKNQLRWQFGVLVPPDHAASAGSERWSMRTEVIVAPGARPVLTVRIRCLQVQHRDIEASVVCPTVADGAGTYSRVDSLALEGTTVVPWDEGVEHEIDVDALALLPVAGATTEHRFELPERHDVELLRDSRGTIAGRAVRRCERVDGVVRIRTQPAGRDGELTKVAITVENTTAFDEPGADRDTAMLRSMIAVHTLLAVDDASFVSLLDPVPGAEQAVADCINDGTFPVLIGSIGTSDVMLSSPIILYDQPAVAPESAGEFCDSTEIDEILALRVMTLTDAEKAEARGTDPRAAAIIDRCDDMPAEIWSRLHGAVRSIGPIEPPRRTFESGGSSPSNEQSTPWWDPGEDSSFDPFTDTMRISGIEVGSGTRVLLHPSRRADAHDLFYAGRPATVKGVFNDVDGHQHVAVVLDDDPAGDMPDWPGRFLYFHPDEIQVLT